MSSGYTGSVDVAFRGDVAILTMRCGENRFNNHFVKSMNEALDIVLSNNEAKALITTGSQGSKFYSNGYDLNWLNSLDLEAAYSFLSDAFALVERMTTFPLPTICAINGHCYAMGAIFSLAHDYRIMGSDRGWWCLNEVHLKLRFRLWHMGFFKAKIGGGCPLNDAVVLGHKYTAQEAKDSAIVQEVSPTPGLIQNTMAFVQSVVPKTGYDRDHLHVMKKDVYGYIFKLGESFPLHSAQTKL